MATTKRWPKGTWMKLRSPATLRALMEQDDFSLGRLARYSDCSKGFISHLLAGRRSSCTPQLAARIAEARDVPVTVLFEARKSTSDITSGNSKGTAA